MTPHDFLAKWRYVDLKERSASQSHFNDLCALLGVLDPIAADPTGKWFTFEKGATKTGGGDGWADVWRRGAFAWEYKGKHANLDKAFAQLQQYAIALENPPLLITSDMDRIRIHTNWTNTVQERHDFTLDDLIDGDARKRLKRAFIDPDFFKPSKTRQALTEETAREFAGIAQRLRIRGHEPHRVAHFVNQLVFCMFAEDVGLLPDNIFTRMLEVSRRDLTGFEDNARQLFGAMAVKNGKVGFTAIDWFNGGLFADDQVLPVSASDIEDLLSAARRDWSQIDPSILGTLFERGLDPGKRSQLGAHYTDRAKIMMIVQPVIVDPLEAEWADAMARMTALVENAPRPTTEKLLRGSGLAKRTRALSEAAAIHATFIDRLAAFRVLDPACGSGNFLYLALRTLKDLEHRANLDAETLGLPRGFPRLGPENVLGIELNPYAAELARVSVWIGEIQWMRSNGFDAARNPILRPLDTIECRDAVLNPDGTRAQWPEADVVVGNPPFLGAKKMIGELGADYVELLRAAYPKLPGLVDLVVYWFAKAWDSLASGRVKRAGLVATNSIRDGASREILKPIADVGGIFEAWRDEVWTVEGASVRVAIICFSATSNSSAQLDGHAVARIFANLTAADSDMSHVGRLKENLRVAFIGIQKNGPFDVAYPEARAWLLTPSNPNGRLNGEVIKPLISGRDITERHRERWIVDFYGLSELDGSLFEKPFEYAYSRVRPERLSNNRELRRRNWWLFGETMPKMRASALTLRRYIVTSLTAKHRFYIWAIPPTICDSTCVVVAREDDTTFGILHSRFHELWALRMGTSLEDRPRYTPSTTFETFPFPEGMTPDLPATDYADDPRARAIASAAARLNELRENWLSPPDLIMHEPEVVPGYPDRILPRDQAAADELKKRTLTNLYNARPQWLANAHAALDAAVADAYGWSSDWRAGMTDGEVLARLFALNRLRAHTASA